jgi:ATP-binding cassette subfamily B protein
MNDDTNVKLKWFGIPKMLPFVKKYRVRIIWMVILGIAASLIDSIYPLFNQYALNHFVLGQTLDTLVWFIAHCILAFWLFRSSSTSSVSTGPA